MSAEPERRVWRSPVPNAKYHIYRPDECLRGNPGTREYVVFEEGWILCAVCHDRQERGNN
jgi:hypothetical protein